MPYNMKQTGGTHISVILSGEDLTSTLKNNENRAINLIKAANAETSEPKYKCNGITYFEDGSDKGKVKQINFY